MSYINPGCNHLCGLTACAGRSCIYHPEYYGKCDIVTNKNDNNDCVNKWFSFNSTILETQKNKEKYEFYLKEIEYYCNKWINTFDWWDEKYKFDVVELEEKLKQLVSDNYELWLNDYACVFNFVFENFEYKWGLYEFNFNDISLRDGLKEIDNRINEVLNR